MRKHIGQFVFVQLLVLFAVGLLLSTAKPSWAVKSASIVIEADSGKVLSEHNADVQTYPASLTKMMTLYLLFDDLRHGKVTLDTQFKVSRHAAAQAPSKLGLKPGQTISVRDLIYGIVTHSANDGAVVVAENLAGSEAAFAQRMTQQARALGMNHTIYVDASGLPNPHQLTTARDLATLARALYLTFPKDYKYFATEEFTYDGAKYYNHNHLMHAYDGMDGIKTGYIHASGFNLAASAVRDGHRLIGIVMGGQSAHSRDMEMAHLLNVAFARENKGPAVLTAENTDTQPDDRSDTGESAAARTLAALSPVGRAEAATPATAHRRVPHARTAHYSIQVGAYSRRGAADRAGKIAFSKLPAPKGKQLHVIAPGHEERYYRVRIANFSERDAERACRVLHRRHVDCAVIAPSIPQEASVNSDKG